MRRNSKEHLKKIFCAVLLVVYAAVALPQSHVVAKDLTSSSFIIRDPIVGTGGGYQSSGSFKLYGSGDTLLTGYGTSATFINKYGFQYYPYATAGTLTATPNGTSVDLAWPATAAGQGYTVSGYKTGRATVSGGPYTYTSVGNVTTYSYTNEAPGTYYFVVQTLDAFGNVIATSNEAAATVQASLTFEISDPAVQFGTIIPASSRYATPSGGSGSNTVAHTMGVSSNAGTGYTITYYGPTLTSGAATIPPATIAGDADGTPGTSQFALSLSTTGSATIPSAYRQASLNWSYAASTTTTVASTSGPTSSETFSFRYLSNASNSLPAGQYGTDITYVLTGNF